MNSTYPACKDRDKQKRRRTSQINMGRMEWLDELTSCVPNHPQLDRLGRKCTITGCEGHAMTWRNCFRQAISTKKVQSLMNQHSMTKPPMAKEVTPLLWTEHPRTKPHLSSWQLSIIQKTKRHQLWDKKSCNIPPANLLFFKSPELVLNW